MIDHLNLAVSNVERSAAFYRQILATLGYDKVFQDHDAYGFGRSHWQFGIFPAQEISPIHLAFVATDIAAVNDFYQKAIDLGATPNGAPGYREQYGNYYAAYILDYDGHNVEAVYRGEHEG